MPRQKSTPNRNQSKKQEKRRKRMDKEILELQNTDFPLIPKLPFSRLVKEIMQRQKESFRITATALSALQEAVELYLTYLFSDAYLLTYHRHRVTLDRTDIRLVLHIRQGTHK
ncbi:histone H3-like centromeric protein cid [Pseudolycoriella hygida]|uniref:Histone H3-like centromeric protein cid n=1 Tax=Pseudolycoriella hygida TaxID=35572 RepID=A0A9Q0N230_9DIPT|nr:histone H3-like centromeric protein cid [Pseudolycoriella hygida]